MGRQDVGNDAQSYTEGGPVQSSNYRWLHGHGPDPRANQGTNAADLVSTDLSRVVPQSIGSVVDGNMFGVV